MFEALQRYGSAIGQRINPDYLRDETELVQSLLTAARCAPAQREAIAARARELVIAVRRDRAAKSGLDAFLSEYDLSSAEGVALMCLAEALLRIPDSETVDALIADRIRAGDWAQHLGESESLFVNASTWGLMLTGRVVQPDESVLQNPASLIGALISRIGEPVVRAAMIQAMRIMGDQFVMGRTIEAALERAASDDFSAYRFSFDMLGEAALTATHAQHFQDAYLAAIDAIGRGPRVSDSEETSSISVKLSALCTRFEPAQADRAIDELVARLGELAEAASRLDVPLTIDAEESARLELTLAVFERLRTDGRFGEWQGLGLAVQAYQRRAGAVIDWLAELAERTHTSIPVRLVKGAYWDTEIKRAQQAGLPGYPVFTRKANTDVSYLACARKLLAVHDRLSPQFATHNANTVAYVLAVAPAGARFEFQRLHGMGEALYDHLLAHGDTKLKCRVYAPVGAHEELLPYLVRRLLENGANTSFVNRISDEDIPVEELVIDPVVRVEGFESISNSAIPAPTGIFPGRTNSAGWNLDDGQVLEDLAKRMQRATSVARIAQPLVAGQSVPGQSFAVTNPADHRQQIGEVHHATDEQIDAALRAARSAQATWSHESVDSRASCLEAAADLYEQNSAELATLCVIEAGKCIPDALNEVREAVDFLRYYATQARGLAGRSVRLPGTAGELNTLSLSGRGVFVCISPWNFPLAIFTGQIAAALVTGNTVIAKPAEQTPLVAARAVELLHEAGTSGDVLQFLPGDGPGVGGRLVGDARVAGVVFTGSTQTAQAINRNLAARDGPLGVLIAETGGQNAMLVDSTALTEQVVRDVAFSAFNSAGQRCSAARLLLVQDDVAERTCAMLAGYLDELVIGDPSMLATDMGPVIDSDSLGKLLAHRETILRRGRTVAEPGLPAGLEHGNFMSPLAVEISSISDINGEHFGPILHILRYPREQLSAVVDELVATGYGLTMGIHTRIESRARTMAERVPIGNVYINRNMIGAVVGSQPFGGQGLSGTGPKSGGPHYLMRFVTEKTISNNTAALGGDAALMSLEPGRRLT